MRRFVNCRVWRCLGVDARDDRQSHRLRRFPDEVLTPLLAYQMNAVKKAAALGAKIACGSDAGAYRVLHGQGGLDERTLLRRAIGEGADTVTDAGNAVIMARF